MICQCGGVVYAKERCRKCYERQYWAGRRKERRVMARAWHAANPKKQTAYYRKFYIANREKIQALNKAWIKANPDYATATKHNHRHNRKGSWSAAEWTALKQKYDNRCLACGLTLKQLDELGRRLVPDHVIPIALGGRNVISNLQPLCHGIDGCNNHKGRKHIDYRVTIVTSPSNDR